MEMSAAYLVETVEHLKARGYEVRDEVSQLQRDGVHIFERIRYHCFKAPDTELVLECLTYGDRREAYYLELVRAGRMRSFSFPLDSWKFRADVIEFKYYVHPETGLGLTFFLDLST